MILAPAMPAEHRPLDSPEQLAKIVAGCNPGPIIVAGGSVGPDGIRRDYAVHQDAAELLAWTGAPGWRELLYGPSPPPPPPTPPRLPLVKRVDRLEVRVDHTEQVIEYMADRLPAAKGGR